jgi:ADP-ribosyl-[dinitrogen reductase] hydrolase
LRDEKYQQETQYMTHFFTGRNHSVLTKQQINAGVGSLIGLAVGDALGAPFEFRPAGLYRSTFPNPVLEGRGEMIGGGAFDWAPGEFTDDTQMALALSEALIAADGECEPKRIWDHFKAWSLGATDIGNGTRAVLALPNFMTAAREVHEETQKTAGNGSVMRVAPIALAGIQHDSSWVRRAASAQSKLTHYDGWASNCALVTADIIYRLITGVDLAVVLDRVPVNVGPSRRDTFINFMTGDWVPADWDHASNGLSFVCLAQAVWAVRNTSSFEEAVTTAVNLGDDADTVGAVTGALAGALYGFDQIPTRWRNALNGQVRQPDGEMKFYDETTLVDIALSLMGAHDVNPM